MKLLDFYAEWCGPCNAMSPTIEKLKTNGPFEVEKINIDENPDLAAKYAIRSIPTLIFVNESGETLWRKSGMHTESQLLEIYNELNPGEIA